ncbi:YciI family protein [Microvirga alba]|uniref:YCII-related domain-containing protein n=1 Tax=Microvirga alba TaxID=2791025 RepID=A0A931BVY6_9HYPH|nr:YciI family protein [Microvirga alba]MBF9234850.1 hypothetical protein [Microvirga alba]
MTIDQARRSEDPQALLARMMRKQLFVILNSAVAEPAALRPYLAEHLNYLIDLEKRGILFASGPFSDENGQLTGDGLTIVRATSFEDAMKIANEDPFTRSGLRKPTVRQWTVNEGRIQISVDLSDCRGDLP